MKAFIDLDGVAVDFIGGVARLYGEPNLIEQWPAGVKDVVEYLRDHRPGYPTFTTEKFWAKIDEGGAAWWAELSPLQAGLDAVQLAGETCAEVYLLSSPPLSPAAWQGKAEWVRRHLPLFYQERRLILTPHKHLVARPGTILVDDRAKTCGKFRQASQGAKAMTWSQPWNVDEEKHRGRLDLLSSMLPAND